MKYKAWTVREHIYLQENHEMMTVEELAEELDRSYGSVRNKLQKLNIKALGSMKEYALYQGEDIVFIGTKKECAEYWGVKESSITFMATPSHRKRIEGKPNRRLVEKL